VCVVSCQDPTAEMVKMKKLFYPKPWLEAIGFFETLEVSVDWIWSDCFLQR